MGIPVLRREIPIKAHAHRADDILTAIRIAREFEVDLTIDHGTEAHLVADEIAASGFPVIVGYHGSPGGPDSVSSSLRRAGGEIRTSHGGGA